MKNCLGKLFRFMLFLLGTITWFVCIFEGDYVAAAIACILTLLFCCKICRFFKNAPTRYAGRLSEDLTEFSFLSEQNILRTCIADALLSRTNDTNRPVARKTIKLRTVFTAVYIALNFLVIQLFYHRVLGLLLVNILAMVYTVAYGKCSTFFVLCRMAKQQPDTNFDVLLRDHTFNSQETPTVKSRATIGIVAFCLSLVAVFAINSQSRYNYTAVDGGYCVQSYRPGILANTAVSIPDEYNGQPVVSIGERAFAKLSYLQEVTVPDSVLYIEKEAFSGCRALETVTLSHSLQRIGVGAFRNCSFAEIQLPDTLTELLAESFKKCSQLTRISIPQGVTEIRANAFEGCSNLKSVQLHDGIIDIHANAFQDCSALESIDLPGGITEIHAYTFENCTSLRRIDIPNGVTRIAAHAFYGCSNLQYADIPLTVTEIGSSAFRLCSALSQVQVAKDTVINERAFKESPTKVYRDALTSSQWNAAVDEVIKKMSDIDVFYYVVSDTQSSVAFSDSSIVELYDDESGADTLEEGYSLQPLNSTAEVTAYLDKAKAAGITQVRLCLFSSVATKAAGEPRFVYCTYAIDEFCSEVKNDG